MNMHVSGYNQYGINHKGIWTHYWINNKRNVSNDYTLKYLETEIECKMSELLDF